MKNDWALATQGIRELVAAIQRLGSQLDRRSFESAVGSLDVPDRGKVIATGVGKSGHVARKIAATFTSLGVAAVFIHPTEAAHGDMALMSDADTLLIFSRSGAATECIPLCHRARHLGCPSILVTEEAGGLLTGSVSTLLLIPRAKELWGHAPTTSTLMQMAVGDLLAVALAARRGYTQADFRMTHPAGELGTR